MLKKSFIFAMTLFIAITPVFADSKISTKYGVFMATIDKTEYVTQLTLAGKKVGKLETDNINLDKIYLIGESQLIILSSEVGNGGYKNYYLVAIFPNKQVKIYNDLIESKSAKYKMKNGKLIASYKKLIITFDGQFFHQSKK